MREPSGPWHGHSVRHHSRDRRVTWIGSRASDFIIRHGGGRFESRGGGAGHRAPSLNAWKATFWSAGDFPARTAVSFWNVGVLSTAISSGVVVTLPTGVPASRASSIFMRRETSGPPNVSGHGAYFDGVSLGFSASDFAAVGEGSEVGRSSLSVFR